MLQFFRSDWWGGRTCAEVSLIVGGKGAQGMQGHSQSWRKVYDLVVEHGTPAAAGPVQFAFQQAASTHCQFYETRTMDKNKRDACDDVPGATPSTDPWDDLTIFAASTLICFFLLLHGLHGLTKHAASW